MISSVVESNLIKVKIVERMCSTFLLFEVFRVLSSAFGHVLDFPLDIAEVGHVHLIFSHQNRGNKGSAKHELFKLLQYKLKIFVGHFCLISETSRNFDAELCEDIFKINLFTVSPSPSFIQDYNQNRASNRLRFLV